MRGRVLLAILCFFSAVGVQAESVKGELIELDPLCTPIAMRNKILSPGNPAPSTRRMAKRLAAIFAKAGPGALNFINDRMANVIASQLTNSTELNDQLRLQYMLGVQQTQAGRPDQALNTFTALEKFVATNGIVMDAKTKEELRLRRAVAYLRLGEQENCLLSHNADSCLFPIQPTAFHLLPRGSRGAIALFNQQLEEHPEDMTTRWLLNIAHMTLGEYPAKVPVKFLIPENAFASEYAMPRFPDVSEGLGVDVDDLAGGVIVDDFDNDGFYDIVVSAWGLDGQLRFFHNNGNGTFTERTSEAGLVGITSGLNIQQTDYNNDGLLDIWVARGAWLGKAGRIPGSLLRNNGDGTFTDVTEEAGLMSYHPSQATRWFDYDGDGWLDLFVGNESKDPADPDWCELYHNNHDGTFTECARVSGINIATFVKGVACADYDNDGRPDLYLSVSGGPNILLHNDGPVSEPGKPPQWHFSDATARAGPVAEPFNSFATFFFDYDNDGWEDLFVSGYLLGGGVGDIAAEYLGLTNQGVKPKLYHNNRDGTFTDVTEVTHINRICHTMGHNYGDLDNDGWLDFYCATGDPDFKTLIPNRMFRNAGGKFFQDVTTATGTGHIQKGHGVAFADLNDDGAQDIYVVMGGAFTGDTARNALYLNPGTTNHWLKLKLAGTESNRAAIGARIKVTLQTPDGVREIHRVVSSGGNFGSNPLRQEIGIGDASEVLSVDICWPGSDTRQTFKGIQTDHSYAITEGNDSPVMLQLHPVNLNHPLTHASMKRALR
ncbi:MAG: repeat protein [Verrucomicrobiales bacterium]|nr:repeat protein [Verrucomicrobiales bacterium]